MSEFSDPLHCVSNNLHQTARAISRIYAEEISQSGIKRSQFPILGFLIRFGPLRLTELADLLFMERTTLTRNLKPLEKLNFVSVTREADDARAKEVKVTDAGQAKFLEARKLWKRAQKRILKKFGVENWRALESSLRELRTLKPDSEVQG